MNAALLFGLAIDIAVAYWVARDAHTRDWTGRMVGERGWMLLTLLLSPLLAIVYIIRRPKRPTTSTSPATLAPKVPMGVGWKRDPTGRHEQRFWDGSGWTDNVSNAGTSSRDPL